MWRSVNNLHKLPVIDRPGPVNASDHCRSSSGKPARRAREVGLFACAAAVAFGVLSQGLNAPFVGIQESLSAQWIADIVRRGDWLLARDYYGMLNLKPPLFYWLSALVAEARGGRLDEAGARIVSVLAAVGLVMTVWAWTRARVGRANAWLAFMFLLGSYGFVSRAAMALTDMLLSALVFGACCVLHAQLERPPSTRRAVKAGLLLGLAVLSKGPVALAVVGLSIFIYLASTRRSLWPILRRAWVWQAVGLALALAAAWYVPALLANRRALLRLLLAENLGHFVPTSLGGLGESNHSFFYPTEKLLRAALPSCLMLPTLCLAALGGTMRPSTARPFLLQLALLVAVLLFFSVSHNVRGYYVLPALPSFAILLSLGFTAELGNGRAARWAVAVRRVTVVSLAFVTLMLVATLVVIARRGIAIEALGLHLYGKDPLYATLVLDGLGKSRAPFMLFVAVTICGAVLIFAASWAQRPLWAGTGLGLIAIAGCALWAGPLRTEAYRRLTVKDFVAEVHRRVGDAPLYATPGEHYEFSFYYGRALPSLSLTAFSDQYGRGRVAPDPRLAAQLASCAPLYLVATPPELRLVAPTLRARLELAMRSEGLARPDPPALYLLTCPINSTGTGSRRPDSAVSSKAN